LDRIKFVFFIQQDCLSVVVSAGWQQTINAFSHAEVQFDIVEREQ